MSTDPRAAVKSTNSPNNIKSTPINTPSLLGQATSMAHRARGISNLSMVKIAAIIVWLGGAFLTSRTLSQLHVPDTVNVFVAIPMQLILTKLEGPIFRGRDYPLVGLIALFIDLAINTSGAWPYTKYVGETDFWTMVQEVSKNPSLIADTMTQFSFALFLGYLTAAGAEYLWNRPD